MRRSKAKAVRPVQPTDSDKATAWNEKPADAPPARQPSPEQIQRQGNQVLAATSFSQAERTRKFLKYIVDQTLAGNAKRLKQYTIATEVLGRDANFDPDADPVVRLEAGKLRRALENYYLRAGAGDQLRILVPKGSYVPVFDFFFDPAGASGAASHKPAHEWAASLSPDSQRVLVLPLNVQFQSEKSRTFSHGLVEQLVVELSRYRDTAVMSSTGSDKPDDAVATPLLPGIEVNARFVVSGSVRRSGNQLRITIRLHDVQAGSIIWSDAFDLDPRPARSLEAQDRI